MLPPRLSITGYFEIGHSFACCPALTNTEGTFQLYGFDIWAHYSSQICLFDWHPRVSGVDRALHPGASAKRGERYIFAVGLDDRWERRRRYHRAKPLVAAYRPEIC